MLSRALILLQERKSYKWKQLLFFITFITFSIAVCVYFHHNWYCRPGGMGTAGSGAAVGSRRCPLTRCASSCSVHYLRFPGVRGGLLQHGLPHDSLLGLRQQGAGGELSAGGQALLSGCHGAERLPWVPPHGVGWGLRTSPGLSSAGGT